MREILPMPKHKKPDEKLFKITLKDYKEVYFGKYKEKFLHSSGPVRAGRSHAGEMS